MRLEVRRKEDGENQKRWRKICLLRHQRKLISSRQSFTTTKVNTMPFLAAIGCESLPALHYHGNEANNSVTDLKAHDKELFRQRVCSLNNNCLRFVPLITWYAIVRRTEHLTSLALREAACVC